MQKQKWCPAVCTTPARCHWVTVKPYSKVYLSSLKGSALTLGVSIDLGNTVPSAPEITKQNRRQIVNIISCYQGSDCQIIPRCNLTHSLTPFLSCTHCFCPREKPDLDYLKLVALITSGICLQPALLVVKAAACTLSVGSVCWPSWCRELGKDTSLLTRLLIQLHPSLMNLHACQEIIFCSERYSKEKTKFRLSHWKWLRSGCAFAWGKGGRCSLAEMQHKQAGDGALVPVQPLVWCETQKSFNFCTFPLSCTDSGADSTIPIWWVFLDYELWTAR